MPVHAATTTRQLTVSDVMAPLNLRQQSSVIKLINTRGLPARKINRRYLIDPDEFERWFNDQYTAGQVAPGKPPASDDSTDEIHADWVAAQVAKFSPDDLRRAGELLLALSKAAVLGGAA